MDSDQLKDDCQRSGIQAPLRTTATEPGANDNRGETDRRFQIDRDAAGAPMSAKAREFHPMDGVTPVSVALHIKNILPVEENGRANPCSRKSTRPAAKIQ